MWWIGGVVQTKDERRVLRAGVRWERRGRVAKQRQFPVLDKNFLIPIFYDTLKMAP